MAGLHLVSQTAQSFRRGTLGLSFGLSKAKCNPLRRTPCSLSQHCHLSPFMLIKPTHSTVAPTLHSVAATCAGRITKIYQATLQVPPGQLLRSTNMCNFTHDIVRPAPTTTLAWRILENSPLRCRGSGVCSHTPLTPGMSRGETSAAL